MRIAIVEDERSYQEQMIKYLTDFEQEYDTVIRPQVFSDGDEIVEAYENGNNQWSIIFLDIKMKNKNGIETAREIRKRDNDVVIIFITSLMQYAIKGYEVDALDFVLKPISYGQFALKMKKALNSVKKRESRFLVLFKGQRMDKVSTDDIRYIEVQNHYLHIVTKAHTYKMRGTMQEIEKELSNLPFARCSNAYLVNLKHVKQVTKDTVYLADTELSITRTKKAGFLQQFSDYLGGDYR
ncbi:LytR/AlgR family response regulator transcription factor [Konateibacter massiliensis]|uniref:LytR/AlgR family response regulator transcription factor n=1 Tax=Konateibacter massiliensis TaxID=2002841 RepID=UPI000C15EBEC|nr:LytTR family DNA-binding domain-containing protein [Konateibacter massiliensis]